MSSILDLKRPTDGDKNILIKAYAAAKGISDSQAWEEIRSTWTPNSEVVNVLERSSANSGSANQPVQPRLAEIVAGNSIEKLKLELELKREERERRKEEAEAERRELDRDRMKQEKDIAERKIELDREIAMRKLEIEDNRQKAKEEFDSKILFGRAGEDKTKDMYERILIEREHADSKFEKLREELGNNKTPTDFIGWMQEYKKNSNMFFDMAFDTLEARLGKDTVNTIRKAANLEIKKDEGTLDKIINMVRPLINSTEVQKAIHRGEQSPPMAPDPKQLQAARETEERIRRETEEKARQLEAENEVLTRVLSEEKKKQLAYLEEREKLESRAIELGIPYNDTIPSDQLFLMIEHHEAMRERELQAEERSMAAMQATQRRKKKESIPAEIVQQETPIQEPTEVTTTGPQQIDEKIELPQDLPDKQFEQELELPREVSPETQEYMKSVGSDEGLKQEPKPEVTEPEPHPEIIEPEQPMAKGKRKAKTRRKGEKQKFKVYQEDGMTLILETEAGNHRGAGMKAIRTLDATEPTIIKVIDEAGDDERIYSAYIQNGTAIVKMPGDT